MSRAETSGTEADGSAHANPDDMHRYVSAVDDLLLDVPWRQRRELVAGLREHLRENPGQITIEPPEEYAAELRAAAATPGGLLSGLRSPTWPTPVQWWESVLRGGAVVMITLVAYKILAGASQAVLGDATATGPMSTVIDQAFRTVYPTPDFRGSTRDGLLVFPLLAVLIGQVTTAAVLRRAPHRRATLRRLTYGSLAVIVLLFGYGALRSFDVL